MSKNKNINLMSIYYNLTKSGELKPSIRMLTYFSDDLTKEQEDKLVDKINELTEYIHQCIVEINGRNENDMLQKKRNTVAKDCLNCEYCIPIGEGDHICEENPHKMVLVDYTPSDDYNWCNGSRFRRK